jgi:hypothetical protein
VKRTLNVGMALVLTAVGGGFGGCAPRASSDTLDAELARLREEERALRAEMAALRDEISRLSEALEAESPPLDGERTPNLPVRPRAEEIPSSPQTTAKSIAALLNAYRMALEAEDFHRLRELYGGELPAEDRRYMEVWFSRADDLQVDMAPQAIEIADGTARAVVNQMITFRQARTRELRKARLRVRMQFEQRGQTWRLVRVEGRL